MARRDPVQRDESGVRNVALVVEYDGRGFAGWQLQPGQRTVQSALEESLAVLCGHPVVVRVAGRTDSGVHAWAQRAHFFTRSTLPCDRLLRGVNALAGDGVRVVKAEEVQLDWDARRNARSKLYCYRILARAAPSALLAGRTWHVPWPLDVDLMEAELAGLLGTFDWTSYCAADGSDPNPAKELKAAYLQREEHEVLAIRFEGSGFLKHMVRILVGTLVEVGLGKRKPGSMVEARAARDRRAAGRTAPAEGLYLELVRYC
ncbi:MAG: tRNA pseudouridine(38-40) synthase TruA [Rickettsiales bacterium]|nr:tRNA pseudouridine(38-40) synthase TruA [Rickettsiales bacterium]